MKCTTRQYEEILRPKTVGRWMQGWCLKSPEATFEQRQDEAWSFYEIRGPLKVDDE